MFWEKHQLMSFFYARFTFKRPFFFRFSTWKWLVSYGNYATISSITLAIGLKCFWFLIALLLVISKVNRTLIIFPQSLRSLPTKPVFERILTKVVCQYILNLMSKKKLGIFDDLINAYFQSFIFLPRYEHFLVSILRKGSLALLNRIQPILERLKENITKPCKPSIIDRSKWC